MPVTQESAAASRIVGRRSTLSRGARVLLVILLVVWCPLIAWDVYRQRYAGPLLVVVWVVALLVLRRRPPTVADASGVRLPWCRRSHISWTEVDTVAPSLPGLSLVRLNLVDGSTVSLGGIAVARSAEAAALGGKRIAAPEPRRWPSAAPPPPPRRRTDRDIEADVARRAQALAEEREGWERRETLLRGTRRPGADDDGTVS